MESKGKRGTGGSYMDVRTLKHRARLQEWSVRISECRASRKSVVSWCDENGINPKTYYYWEKALIRESTQAETEPSEGKSSVSLVQIQPNWLQYEPEQQGKVISIRCGNSVIELPIGMQAETIAELVGALNRHA